MLIELKNIDIAHRDKTLISNVEFYVEEGEFVYMRWLREKFLAKNSLW